MLCVILAGGLGTRMASFTKEIPKALIPVGGVPFVDLQLAWLASQGVRQVLFSIGYKGEVLREHVGDGRRLGLDVSYVDEGTELRGTAGALRLALERGALPERFLLTYGDSFLPIDFGAVASTFVASGKPAAMTILENGGRWDTSNVVVEASRLVLYDKKRQDRPAADYRFIDYGLSALERSVIEELVPAGGKHDLADVFRTLSQRGRLEGIVVTERFYEVGSPAGLADLTAWVEAGRTAGTLAWLDRVAWPNAAG